MIGYQGWCATCKHGPCGPAPKWCATCWQPTWLHGANTAELPPREAWQPSEWEPLDEPLEAEPEATA